MVHRSATPPLQKNRAGTREHIADALTMLPMHLFGKKIFGTRFYKLDAFPDSHRAYTITDNCTV